MRITRAEVALKVTDGGEKQFLFCTDVSEPDCSKLKTTRWKTGHTEVIHTDTLGMIVSSHTIAEFTHEALRLSRPLKPGQPLSTVALLSPLPPPPYTHTQMLIQRRGGGRNRLRQLCHHQKWTRGKPSRRAAHGLLRVRGYGNISPSHYHGNNTVWITPFSRLAVKCGNWQSAKTHP